MSVGQVLRFVFPLWGVPGSLFFQETPTPPKKVNPSSHLFFWGIPWGGAVRGVGMGATAQVPSVPGTLLLLPARGGRPPFQPEELCGLLGPPK